MGEDLPPGAERFFANIGPGSRVAGYLLEEQVGAGGMAVVFRAVDERLGRPVALKMLTPALAADRAFRQRFIKESRAAAAVDDPHIIPVHEAGEADGVLFIAMRWVPGGDVRMLLNELGPMPGERVAAIISPVASALDAAHAAGLVHRDVKPANMLVDRRPDRPDHVYPSDFGLSKGTSSSVSLTATGLILGTPSYMAPEQIEGGKVDGRADQYALACATFEMLAGEPPFQRDLGIAVALAHLQAPPPALSSRRPDLPTAVDQVLARALAKSVQDRYPICREFAEALRAALGLAPYHAHTAGRDRPADPYATQLTVPADVPAGVPVAAAPAAAEVIPPIAPAATSTVGPAGGAPTPSNTATRTAATTGTDVTSRGQARAAMEPTLEGDAAAEADHDQETGVTAARTAASTVGTTRPVPDSADGTEPPAERRGSRRRILVTLGGIGAAAVVAIVVLVNLLGAKHAPNAGAKHHGHTTSGAHASAPIPATFSRAATLTDPRSGPVGILGLTFRPNHPDMLAIGDGKAYLWNAQATSPIATITDPVAGYRTLHRHGVQAVAFSPDGSTLATGDETGHTYVWNVATGSLIATLTDPNSGYYGVQAVAFSRDGSTLATGDDNGLTYLWNADTGSLLATLTDPGKGTSVLAVAFSSDGTTLATGDYTGSTYLWNVATRRRIATLTDPGNNASVNAVAFSRYGSTLAVGDETGSTYIWNAATGRRIATLTDPHTGQYGVQTVAFSPAGNVLAAGDDNGNTYLWNVATGSRIATLTVVGLGSVQAVAFSQAGNTLAVGGVDGRTYVWKYS